VQLLVDRVDERTSAAELLRRDATFAISYANSRLEHFGVRLNREGFPRTVCRDSNCMLEREASVHGSIPFR
jgi:hypothetical protein